MPNATTPPIVRRARGVVPRYGSSPGRAPNRRSSAVTLHPVMMAIVPNNAVATALPATLPKERAGIPQRTAHSATRQPDPTRESVLVGAEQRSRDVQADAEDRMRHEALESRRVRIRCLRRRDPEPERWLHGEEGDHDC